MNSYEFLSWTSIWITSRLDSVRIKHSSLFSPPLIFYARSIDTAYWMKSMRSCTFAHWLGKSIKLLKEVRDESISTKNFSRFYSNY